MKRSQPEQIGQLIDRLMQQYRLDSDANAHRAVALWKEIVGPGLQQYTTRVYVRRDVLHVHISSAPLKNELLYRRQALLQEINAQLKTPIQSIQLH